uniref:SAGA-associated factor 11 n=1 Tax=Eucampia antarctica TaxID=49252 RepID=A0A7S2WKT2_9STRA|mmetsp:Transcript_4446/g.4208  ORF Transcript_4446/g.4208 Transcript_4446/m.4208 type:complete len:180 (+) Transcript_4446:148-687(+)|eukprot:CAMPEP_0197837568 /NCGR_PEP_ID=MMETSP1437-20131217/32542_1 /TAXON_ID=49252 ORGANISM="Eucampia antarctica, Strain CCMP1452" /NCGR_SAMPLE_ID=MMETSP1437 /ASSEMBLY_ACC=CAM_ASM_001096 /LENGTH=179 /DNA_ID=CAMNT_0043444715 /DNA_START=145 /DNA_END=684 /DNA_ORIENTATION=-
MKERVQNPSEYYAAEDIFDDMVTALSIEIACGAHRMAKTGEFKLSDIMLPRERVNDSLGSWKTGDDKHDEKDGLESSISESLRSTKGSIQGYNDLYSTTDSTTNDNSQKPKSQSTESSGRDSSYDIWGRIPSKEPKTTVKCKKCGKNVSAIRFAPHLDKCMGLGTSRRNSSSSVRSAAK